MYPTVGLQSLSKREVPRDVRNSKVTFPIAGDLPKEFEGQVDLAVLIRKHVCAKSQ